MLRLIIGKAGAGKTGAIIEEIRQAVAAGRGGSMLLVPEQYSHEAERELCRVCGDALSLCGEVFSFTGLARRVLQQQFEQYAHLRKIAPEILASITATEDAGVLADTIAAHMPLKLESKQTALGLGKVREPLEELDYWALNIIQNSK